VQLFRRGHTSEVWRSLQPGRERALHGGRGSGIKMWARTDEPVFASEEQDAQLDATLDKLGDGLDEVRSRARPAYNTGQDVARGPEGC